MKSEQAGRALRAHPACSHVQHPHTTVYSTIRHAPLDSPQERAGWTCSESAPSLLACTSTTQAHQRRAGWARSTARPACPRVHLHRTSSVVHHPPYHKQGSCPSTPCALHPVHTTLRFSWLNIHARRGLAARICRCSLAARRCPGAV